MLSLVLEQEQIELALVKDQQEWFLWSPLLWRFPWRMQLQLRPGLEPCLMHRPIHLPRHLPEQLAGGQPSVQDLSRRLRGLVIRTGLKRRPLAIIHPS